METGAAITQAVNAIGVAALAFTAQLAPGAQAVAKAGTGIAIGAMCLGLYMNLYGLIPALGALIVRVTLFGYAIGYWPTLLTDFLDGSDALVALAVPGWTGPTSAFTMASEVSQRLSAAWPALDWPAAMIGSAVQLAITGVLITVCLYLISIAVLCTKVLFVVAGSMGPVLLCLGMIPGFLDVGMGPVRFLLRAALTYVGTATVGAYMVAAITSLAGVGGLDQPLATDAIQGLFALSLLGCVLTLVSGSIGGMVMGGAFSGGGVSSVLNTGSTVMGGASSVTSITSGAGAAAGAVSSAAGNSMGGGTKQGAISTSSSGRAFR